MTEVFPVARLSRATWPDTTALPPIRIVHLGLGAFHRAHQAWYTAHASDAHGWGIAAFTGRSPDAAATLAAQDGLFTLVERGPVEDRTEVVRSIVRARPGDDIGDFLALMARPDVAVVTLTLTEAGYRLDSRGMPDIEDAALAADLRILRSAVSHPTASLTTWAPTTALGRLVLGLEARRRAGSPPLAIVPCDNLPDNGEVVRRALEWLASQVNEVLVEWMRSHTSVVSTSVDRITPRTTAADLVEVTRLTGVVDEAAVITEPFSDWVLSGAFPSGRPDWESAGARFVEDIEPWEARKLWMLNGAHSALAALGAIRGYTFVHEAIADPVCRDVIERLWDEDSRQLPDLDLDRYRASLVQRFANPRIAHGLAQVAQDATTKMRVRIVPVALRERADGRSAAGCAAAIAAWALSVRRGFCAAPQGAPIGSTDTRAFVAALDGRLGDDGAFCAEVDAATERFLYESTH